MKIESPMIYSELPNKQTHPNKRAGMESFVIYCMINCCRVDLCAACERMELLKTEIDCPPPPPSFFRIPKLLCYFGTYGM